MLTKSKLTYIKNLLQKKHREEEGKFIIEGWKSIEEAIHAGVEIETILYDEHRFANFQVINSLKRFAKEVLVAKAKEIDTISDTVASQGILAVIPKLSTNSKLQSVTKKSSALVVVLDGVTDPGNMGTIIRTCDWFGVDALVVGNNSVELYNPKVVRSTMGSLFHLPIVEESNLKGFLEQSKTEKFTVYSTELSNSNDIRKIVFSKKSILIIGNESHGISKEISSFADSRILIPQFGKAESLNAAMACGIILSHIRLK
ncbi:MAG: RNA methyltransferase [Bacteroidota bacterium]|nr:RNA methyltransferase [Bacteroidota bacterium]